MKKKLSIAILTVSTILLFTHCSMDDDIAQNQAEKNTQLVNDVLVEKDIKFLHIYNYNVSTDSYELMDEIRTYPADTYFITSTYLVLNTSKQTYYNFNYLVYFEVYQKDEFPSMSLYFRFNSK